MKKQTKPFNLTDNIQIFPPNKEGRCLVVPYEHNKFGEVRGASFEKLSDWVKHINEMKLKRLLKGNKPV